MTANVIPVSEPNLAFLRTILGPNERAPDLLVDAPMVKIIDGRAHIVGALTLDELLDVVKAIRAAGCRR